MRQKRAAQQSAGTSENTEEVSKVNTSSNRRSTVNYQLKDRNAIQIPNPVYTCDATGRVVINIQVSGAGGVSKVTFNKNASSTSNGCLVDQALEYAKQAIFNSEVDLSRKAQMRDFVEHIDNIPDWAEDVADRLAIYAIKRTL